MIEIVSIEDTPVTDEEAREAVETIKEYCSQTTCDKCTLKSLCEKRWIADRPLFWETE